MVPVDAGKVSQVKGHEMNTDPTTYKDPDGTRKQFKETRTDYEIALDTAADRLIDKHFKKVQRCGDEPDQARTTDGATRRRLGGVP